MQLVEAMASLGALTTNQVHELSRWGEPDLSEVADTAHQDLAAPEVLDRVLGAALHRIHAEAFRETDPDITRAYVRTLQLATLRLRDTLGEGFADVEVCVGCDLLGNYILPWRGEGLADMLTDGETHLLVGGECVYFGSVREMYYGDRKAFLVCAPSTRLPNGPG